MAKGCVYIPKTGKDAGKVFGSKETLAAHMNYTPAMADVMAKYQQTGGAMDVGSVTKWLTDNGYLKAEGKKPTATPKPTEGTKKETTGVSKSEQAGLEILNKYGVQRFTDWLTNQPLVGGFFGIRDIANKYGIKFPQTEKEFDAEVKKNGGIDNYMGSMADTFISKMKQVPVEKKPTKKEFPKAPVTDAVKAALKSVDNTTAAIMNLAKVLPTVYESITKQIKITLGKPVSQQVAEAYHNAVENGVEPELVAAVENAVALQEQMKSKPSLADNIETAETLEVEGVSNGVRVSNKASMADLERKHAGNATKKATIAMARAAAKTLKSVFPMMDIHLHENTSDYNNAMANLGAQQNSAGNFTYSTSSDGTVVGRIDINLNRATPRTVVHEVTHAVLLKTFGDSSPAFLEFRNNLEKIISKSGNKRLSDFADKYKDIADDIGQAEEYLAELGGILSDKETPLDYGLVRRIAEMINKVVSTITFGRLKPFEDLQNQKDTLEFFNTIAQSIKTGSSLENLMVAEPYSSSIAIEVDPDGTFTKSKIKTKAAIGDYIIPKGKKDLAIATVPTKSLAEVIREYNGRVVIITSDATGYGVDSKGREIYGGPGFANNKKNVDDEIGFASLNVGTVKSVYTSADKAYGKGKTLVLIMVQPPHTTINNSYGTQYFMESLIDISKNENWNEIKADMERLIREGKGIKGKYPEKTRARDIDRLVNFFNKINPKSDADALTKEYLEITGFQSRSKIAKTFMLDQPNTRINVKSAKTKKAFLDNGVTIYNFLKEYGDDTILTDEMMRNNEGGYVVAGFEIDVTSKAEREALIEEIQGKGIEHPLFNAKLPGTNHFVLDGLYDVNENFAQYAKPNMEITLPDEELNRIVREQYPNIDDYKAEVRKEADKINKDNTLSEEEKQKAIEALKVYTSLPAAKKISLKENYLSKIKGALVPVQADVATSVAGGKGFVPIKGAAKKLKEAEYTKSRQLPPSKIKSKAQIFGETGAARMENAEKALNNLQVARDMEAKFEKEERTMTYVGPSKATENAQKIKLATGWERGADGMWRLEIPDGQLKPIDLDNMYKDGGVPKAYLDEIYDSKELYDAYPTARDIRVSFVEADDFKGAYNKKDREIELAINNFDEPMDMLSTLLHEVQHYIQYEEGFATGSSTSSVVNKALSELKLIREQMESVKNEMKEPGADVSNLQDKQAALEGKYKRINQQITNVITDARKRMNVELKGPAEQRAFVDMALRDSDVRRELYVKAAGEVEARNVQKRMGLSEEERMNKLLSSTEDVLRSDQLVLGAALKGETPTLKSKAQIVYDETGFITTDSMIEIVGANDPTYLGDVMNHILDMGEKLRSGNVGPKDLAKAYMMAVSSIQSKDQPVRNFENAIGEKVDEVFVEKERGTIRPEGAMAYLLTTPEGKRMLDNIDQGKIDAKDRAFIANSMRPFGMYGEGQSKFNNLFGTTEGKQINLTNINEFADMLKGGVQDEQKFFNDITKLKGISQAKVGFVTNFLGIGTRGVIDTREIKGWLRGVAFMDDFTESEAAMNTQLTKSLKNLTPLQSEILRRMRVVGEAMNIEPALAEYIGHHMIWDAVKNERTTHDGLYLAMKQNEDDFNKRLSEIKANPELKTKAQMVDNNAKQVADLYAQMREGGGWAERQKINAILDQDPKLSYIYNNFKAITQMLEDAKLLTKSGNCP